MRLVWWASAAGVMDGRIVRVEDQRAVEVLVVAWARICFNLLSCGGRRHYFLIEATGHSHPFCGGQRGIGRRYDGALRLLPGISSAG